MAEAAESVLDDIHAELDALEGVAIAYTTDARKKTEHKAPPFVDWSYGDFEHDNPDIIGGPGGAISSRVQTLKLTVWHHTKEDAIRVVENLQRAFRKVAYGPNFRFGKFSWLTDDKPAHGNLKVKLTGTVTLRLQVLITPPEQKTIASQTHSVEVNEEQVC